MSNFRNLLKRNLEIRITSMTKTGTTNPQTKDTGNQGITAKKTRKNKTENQATGSSGNKQADPDSLTCHICNQVFTYSLKMPRLYVAIDVNIGTVSNVQTSQKQDMLS